jgi:hypothetical protein
MRALDENENPANVEQGARGLMTSAAIDSYCLVWYDFEQMNWQGWTTLDNTAQIDEFFHVDDFAGLGGGAWGLLYAIEGSQSMWCGTRAGTDGRAYAPYWYTCSWIAAPGYGNGWNQILTTDAIPFRGLLEFSYHGVFDSEPDFDFTTVEYDAGDDNWVEIAEYDGTVDTVATHVLLLSQVATKFRFHFTADGAWSDQDGLWDTDGGCIVDSLLVAHTTGVINYENWEDEALDQKYSDDLFWVAEGEEAFGAYVGLANNLQDKDPCGDNFASQIIFYQGSSYPSADYPGYFDTPFCMGGGGTEAPCQNESLVSPVIDLALYSTNCDENQNAAIPSTAGFGGLVYRFTVYRDLPLANLVFYTWGIRSIDALGCPGQWQDRNFVYYGGDKDYIQGSFDVSDLWETEEVQVTIGVADMCDVWFDAYGDCANHTPSPWIDNVRLYRYETVGPQWAYRDLDIFQDNFPIQEFALESWVRADAANDLRANDDPVIDPGDSAVVDCTASLAGGLDTTVTGEEAVYCHVYAEYIGIDGLKSDLYGPTLAGTYGTYVSDDGSQWTILHCPTAITGAGNEAADKYMIDLNDSLFTRGYRINYYFKAYDKLGASSTLPANAETGGNIFEFTCLPTLNSPVLFVDDFHGRGTFDGTVQQYWDPALAAVEPGETPDRYDVNGPSSLVSNGPGSRAKQYQLATAYEKIIWDSGNLTSGTITEGTDHSDKSNDAQMLVDWLDLTAHKTGLWVCGDDVAYDLSESEAPVALALTATYCGVTFVEDSYYELTGGRTAGGVVTPLVTGLGIYAGISYYAFAGCPIINQFDVIEITGNGAYSLQLPDYEDTQYYIGVSCDQLNTNSHPMRTSWIGHSFMYVRNGNGGTLARNELVNATWEFFQNDTKEDITDTKTPAQYALMQNYPNPFNPTTQISFSLPRSGHVSLKIYNVAGQLVRTLANEEREAGTHTVSWNGTNDLGSSVASGVYFYKIEADNFQSTKKMVLLK